MLLGEGDNDSLLSTDGQDTLAGGEGNDSLDGLASEIDESQTFTAAWITPA